MSARFRRSRSTMTTSVWSPSSSNVLSPAAGRVLEAGCDLLAAARRPATSSSWGAGWRVVVAGIGEQVADQSFERVCSRFGPLEVDAGSPSREPIACRCPRSANSGVRRSWATLVTRNRLASSASARRLRGLAERVRHALDRLCDVRDLADPAARDRDRQVAAGDLVDLGAQPGERRDHPAAGEPDRDREAGEQDDDSAEERDERPRWRGRRAGSRGR